MSHSIKVADKINFERLRGQRLALMEIADLDYPADLDRREKLAGLMNLIDALVDAWIEDGIDGATDALLTENQSVEVEVTLTQRVQIDIPAETVIEDVRRGLNNGTYDAEIFEAVTLYDLNLKRALLVSGGADDDADLPTGWEGTD